jgi:hypothetical protein
MYSVIYTHCHAPLCLSFDIQCLYIYIYIHTHTHTHTYRGQIHTTLIHAYAHMRRLCRCGASFCWRCGDDINDSKGCACLRNLDSFSRRERADVLQINSHATNRQNPAHELLRHELVNEQGRELAVAAHFRGVFGNRPQEHHWRFTVDIDPHRQRHRWGRRDR